MGILVNLFLIIRLTLTVRAPDGFVKKAPLPRGNDARDEQMPGRIDVIEYGPLNKGF